MSNIDRDLTKVYNKIEMQKQKLSNPTMSVSKLADMATNFDNANIEKNKLAFDNYIKFPTEENYNSAKNTLSKKSFVLPQNKEINDEMLKTLDNAKQNFDIQQNYLQEMAKVAQDGDENSKVSDITQKVMANLIDQGIVRNIADLNNFIKQSEEMTSLESQRIAKEELLPKLQELLNSAGTKKDALNIAMKSSEDRAYQTNMYGLLEPRALKDKDIASYNENIKKQDKKMYDANVEEELNKLKPNYIDAASAEAEILKQMEGDDFSLTSANQKLLRNFMISKTNLKKSIQERYGSLDDEIYNFNLYGLQRDVLDDVMNLIPVYKQVGVFENDESLEEDIDNYLINVESENFLDPTSENFEENLNNFQMNLNSYFDNSELEDRQQFLFKSAITNRIRMLNNIMDIEKADSKQFFGRNDNTKIKKEKVSEGDKNISSFFFPESKWRD